MKKIFIKKGVFFLWILLWLSILLACSYSGAQSNYRNHLTLDVVAADVISYTLLFGIIFILAGNKPINQLFKQSYLNNVTAFAIFASVNAPMFSLAASLYNYSQESFKVIYSHLIWYEVIPNVIFFIVYLWVALKNIYLTPKTESRTFKFTRSKIHLFVMSGFIAINLFSIPPLVRKTVRITVFHYELPLSQYKYLVPVSLLPVIIVSFAYYAVWATFIRRKDRKTNKV
ncbi:hypothetical protein O0Q50_22785 [Priestia aryabhattai]|uniref:Uncharacterized protein n=1 Tax=Priestia aryabhattai TaxID=412384 RepID=A0AAX6NDT1_PRIAR|nr:hypothetical protein [Priestia aryabhattai]MDU9694012.1 hypothetical protein [Priestia aryabhattai]